MVTGQTPEIGEHLDFEMYDIVWWWDRTDKPNATDDPIRISHWLGISHRLVSYICFWIITETSKLVSKTSVEHVEIDDYLKRYRTVR